MRSWTKSANNLPKSQKPVLLITAINNDMHVGHYDSYFDRFYISGFSFTVDEIHYWMDLPNMPAMRSECVNCAIKDKCNFAYNNVNGSLSPCTICKHRKLDTEFIVCGLDGPCGNNRCQWREE